MNSIIEVTLIDRALEIKFRDERYIKFEDCWLRDNCRCRFCRHPSTGQRTKHLLEIPDAYISDFEYNEAELSVTWSDNHSSIYEAKFLSKFDYGSWSARRRLNPVTWCGKDVLNHVTRIRVEEFLTTVDGASNVFKSILDYGFAFIEGVKPTLEDTERVIMDLGGLQHTIFGGMWSLSANENPTDLAFTNLPIRSHTDYSFFVENAGLQTFHCLEHNGSGGETTLVDGFDGAMRLKREHPEDYEFLTSFDVETEWLGDGHHQSHSSPVIKIDKETQDIVQIRLNTYTRSPMAFRNGEECRTYYRALKNLVQYYEDPENCIQFKLNPGVVLVFDNFRLLHGRTAFNGHRVLCGGSVTRSDWLDKARVLCLIQ